MTNETLNLDDYETERERIISFSEQINPEYDETD